MKKLLIILGCIVLSIFIWNQYRHFYHVGNMTFTVWKKYGGYCYITPYKYWGISAPKKDYIKLSNIADIDIYIDKDSTLLIFNDYLYLKYPDNKVECNFSTFKYKHFMLDSLSSIENTKLHELERIIYKRKYPFIYIDIRHMKTEIQDSSISMH